MVVKGVVCKKNVAHRRMRAKIEKARLLILGGGLEYQRVSNQLSSFDTLLQQVKFACHFNISFSFRWWLDMEFAYLCLNPFYFLHLHWFSGKGSSKDGCCKNSR